MAKVARVQLPDGRVARFSVPDNATPEQVMAAAKRQFAQPKQRGGFLGAVENVFSSGNELLIGGAEGLYNAASAITDPLAEKAMNLIYGDDTGTRARQGANRGRRKIVNAAERTFTPRPNPVARTVGRIGGSMVVPLPGKKLQEGGRFARGAYRALQGAVGGASVREVDEDATAPAAIGAAANVVLPPVLSKIAQSAPAQAVGRGISKVAAPVINMADDAAETVLPGIDRFLGRQYTPLQGLPNLPPPAPLAALGRKAQARAARFKSLGVDKPTTGMVTRDPKAFSFEQNTAKLNGIGDDLAQQMQEVETTLVAKGRSLASGAKGPEAAGKAVEDVLDTKRGEMQQVTSRLYDKIRETRGEEPVGNLQGLREFMDSPMVVDNAAFDAMRESVSRRLTRIGDKPVTVGQAEELRKFIGGLGSGIDPSIRMMRGKLIDALDDDVVASVGDDAFKAARASARARFEEFGKTFPGKLADEKLAPELLTKRILGDGVKLSDLRALKGSLLNGTDEQVARGQEAWRSLQAQAVDDLMGKAVDEDGLFKGSTLAREFGKSAPKFREILDPADFKTLRRLAAASRDVKALPVGHSVNTSNTAVTLANMFDNGPQPLKEGWAKFLGRMGIRAGTHAGASAIGGPFGNLAVEGARAAGSAMAAHRAEQVAAQALMDKIRMAQNPEAAAAAIKEAQAAAASSPAVADFLNKAGMGRLIGGVAAAQ